MGRLFTVSLEGRIYTCKYCRTHLALHEDFFSKSSRSTHGEVYIFDKVVNVTRGELNDRIRMMRMTMGWENAAVIFCVGCGAMMGLTYECTNENGQNYKDGKSVLDRSKLSLQRLDGGSSA